MEIFNRETGGTAAQCRPAAGLHPGAERAAARCAETGGTQEATPVWLAALQATSCQARTRTRKHAVRWDRLAGRAVYTNAGIEDESIEPFGVSLPKGQTLAVSWAPGETEFTLEVLSMQ